MNALGAVPQAALAKLRREEVAHRAAERQAVMAYLRELKRAGVHPTRLPASAGLLGGGTRLARKKVAAPRATPRALASALPGLADLDLAQPLPWRASTLTLPFKYSWTWTKWIYYAPGTLTAHANHATGAFGVKLKSDHDSNQVNKSRARAAIGTRYQPTEPGLLQIQPRRHLEWEARVKSKMRSARAFGWTGLLVQSFDTSDDRLVDTPVDDRRMHFDLHDSGWALGLPPVEFDIHLPADPLPSLIVDPSRWYAIWLWCGGGIRAAGWQTVLGANVGSDAASRVDVRVDRITLYFTPIGALAGGR